MRQYSNPAPSSSRRSARALAAAVGALGLTAGALATVPPPTTRPADWNNAGGDNAYVNPANWNPALASAPANDNNEFLTINNGGTAVIAAGDNAEGAFLNLGLRPGDTGSLQITGGTLTVGELRVGGRETIANDLAGDWLAGGFTANGGGTGSVVQSGSSVVSVTFTHGNNPDTGANYEPPIQSTYVGDAGLASGNTADGSYTIKDNATLLNGIAANDQLVVGTGVGTHGTFLQQDTSTVTSAGSVIVGRQGATASYTLTGGSLNAQGNSGLFVADGATADGTAVATDGSGNGTVATFTQSGGTVTLTNALEVGRRGGTGTYTMSGGSLSTGAELRVGSNGNSSELGVQSGTGSFSLSGGSVTVGTNLHVGIGGGSTANTVQGTLDVTGGSITLTAAGAFFAVGNGRNTVGTVNHSGGTVSATGATATLDIGRNNGGSATYNLSGTGQLDVTTISVSSNGSSTHSFNMTGGTLNANAVTFGSNAATSARTFSVSGGTAKIGTFGLGGSTNSNGKLVYSGGTLLIDSLTLASTSQTTINADIDFRNRTDTAGTSITTGNAEVLVNGTASATFSGNFTNNSRTLTKTGPGTLTISGNQTNSGNATFNVNAGTVNLNSNANGNLTLNANSTVNFGSSQSLKTLNVADGVTATLVADGARTLTAVNLNLNSSGTLDLANNSLVIPYTTTNPTATVVGYLHSAYASGAWTGAGLTSSTAKNRADHAGGLGWSDSGTQLFVTYTWAGDLNLDKKIDGDDYTLIDSQVAKFGLGAAGQWKNGDVNYDGVVSVADYAVMDAAFGHQNGGLSPDFLADREAKFGSAYVADLVAAVPEPTSLGLLAATAGLALARRRTHRRA